MGQVGQKAGHGCLRFVIKALGVDRGSPEGRAEREEGIWCWVNNASLLLVWELVLFTGATLLCIFYHVTYLPYASVFTPETWDLRARIPFEGI